MITQNQLEELGFTISSKEKSMYDGQFIHFYKNTDNGHVIKGHDTTEIFVTKDTNLIIIEINHHSSYVCSGRTLVFKGKCEDIQFFTEILNAVLKL